AWVASLGADTTFVGRWGDDVAGSLATAELEARGVRVRGRAEGRTAVVCTLVSPDGERSLAPDRGSAPELRADDLEPAWLSGSDHLFVSGYALFREPIRTAARRAVELARAHSATVSVDLASWSGLQQTGVEAVR